MKENKYNIDKNSIPKIKTIRHLSRSMKIGLNKLYDILNNTNKYYDYYIIPKRSKGNRVIYEPKSELKYLQKCIQRNILCKIHSSPYSMAYKKGISICDNAKCHVGKKYILKIDLKDYFSQIKVRDVSIFFTDIGYSSKVSFALSRICCLNGSLPQGAPTSPQLSNILTSKLDYKINSYCKDFDSNIVYTRYSDDIIISGDFGAKDIIPDLIQIIERSGLRINYDKISVIGQNKKQEVTGIVVNDKIQVSKSYRKKIRQELYYIHKYGIEEHMKFNKINCSNKDKYLTSLRGKINYCLQVNPNDIEMKRYKIYLKLF